MVKLIRVLLLGSILIIGCGEKKDHDNSYTPNNETEGPVKPTDTTLVDTQTSPGNKNIIHEGVIDLASIDLNKDNEVFQCPMDWNVIADHPGNCPVCKMELEEFSTSEARDNLVKNDYQVK